MLASHPDLLRLLAVPAFAWAAYRDVRVRRVPNRLWYPLAALGVVLLAWDAAVAWPDPFARQALLVRTAASLLVVVPLAYGFWLLGGFGGADAKAFMVLAVLFPTYPTYYLSTAALPVSVTRVGVFSLTVLTNAVVVGALYPVALAVGNAARGRTSKLMFLGRVVDWEDLPAEAGRLMEDAEGYTRNGLDLDALRMYLRWRGLDLADLRADPDLRDPATLPEEPNDPTDGRVEAGDGLLADGGEATGDDASGEAESVEEDEGPDDPWGAAAFLDAIDGDAYGTTPRQLRDGLDLVVDRETVWISPGIPFMVPLLAGLVVGLAYGDLLVGLLGLLGLV